MIACVEWLTDALLIIQAPQNGVFKWYSLFNESCMTQSVLPSDLVSQLFGCAKLCEGIRLSSENWVQSMSSA